MHVKEQKFLKSEERPITRTRKRSECLESQKKFDRRLRFYDRQYRQSFCEEIESMTTTNPNEFWTNIRKIGPRKRSDIPMEVYGNDGNVLYDEKSVRTK